MDTPTRIQANCFSIYVCCFGKDRLVKIKSLSVADARNKHTSDCLRKIVSGVLKHFQIESSRLFLLLPALSRT